MALKLGKHRNEVGFEEAGNMSLHEALEPRRVAVEALELLGHHQTLLPHLLPPPPYRQAGAGSRPAGGVPDVGSARMQLAP